MALIQKKSDDKKYAHLKKMYTNGTNNPLKPEKIESQVDSKLPIKTLKITRKQIAIDFAYVLGLFLLAISGYLITKII